MVSSFQQWESDPLFSAAEVVQDSADRMESIFHLLLHEQSLVRGEHPDKRLLTSIQYHRRDLETTLETARWQLEDFERAVDLSARKDNSYSKEAVILRHKQFIGAIREQIIHVDKSLEDLSTGNASKNSLVNLNRHEIDGLALFLSGGVPEQHSTDYKSEDSNLMRIFLDPNTASSLNDINDEIVEQKTHDFDSIEENNVNYRHNEDVSWDLEAYNTKGTSVFYKNKFREFRRKMNIFWFFCNLWTYGTRVGGSFSKRWKDGEEQNPSSSYRDVSHSVKGNYSQMRSSGYVSIRRLCSKLFSKFMLFHSLLVSCWAKYQKFSNHVQVNRQFIQLVSAIIITLLLVGVLIKQIY